MELLNKIPLWAYLLFAFLVFLGLKATRPRAMSIYRLIILPAIFTIWNLVWLSERVHEQLSLLPLWFVGILVGFVLGWKSVSHWKIKADRKNKCLTLPGSWSIIFLILSVFVVRSYFVYTYETHPAKIEQYFIYDSLLSGIFTGIFIGRAFDLYRKYKKG